MTTLGVPSCEIHFSSEDEEELSFSDLFDGIVEESERLEGEAYCDDSALVDGIDYACIDDLATRIYTSRY